MGNYCVFCALFAQFNWLWYAVASVVVFILGALWYSVFFRDRWIKVFRVEMQERPSAGSMVFTMSMQLLVTLLLGLVIMLLTLISGWLALLVLVAFCGWQKGSLKFRYARWREYFMAATIEAGYLFVAGGIFILFGLIGSPSCVCPGF